MINHLLKFSISSMALFSLWGCHSTNSEYINTGMCRGEEYDVDEQDCVAGSLVDACNDKNLYSIIHSKDVAYACRGDSSWTEASKNEVYFERGCDKGNENATLEYGYSTMVCIQDTSHTWKWVVDSEVEASRLKSSSSSSDKNTTAKSSTSSSKPKSSSSAEVHRVEGTVKYDGYTYKTVGIGTQMWMAENLRATTGIDSSWCFNDEPENCETYGRLYTWATAMGIDEKYQTQSALKDGVISDTSYNRGICPKGWHIPSDAEWQTLFDFVDASNGVATAGQSLCDPNGAWKGYDDYPMTDDYGFSAIPGGKYHYAIEGNNNVGWKDLGASMHVWSATESADTASTNVYTRYIQPKEIDRNDFPKKRRRYVRCVKDE
ncbi:major paralogous domain-containing protein [Fibrobacter sp. UWH9]|nr:hypothetical protein [Fibrobacter succinogenes]OWV03328.1 hypothetical protein B7993_13695 [Fibrobacter sp. UWH3]OWV15592.1 hypothetical protein B7992_04205 [Fibrobacter sp. UWH1]SHH87566.1 major paralogous domain-containing protein [Fibrobacter sp. UWH9]SHL67314.1 major paralogous domain-containing protein [Fibrobacter sp. UWH6]SHL83882.1 major paralogous domain-containing protein [Fibrobacter sp. UWH5]